MRRNSIAMAYMLTFHLGHGIWKENDIYTMLTGDLAACVARSSLGMVLTILIMHNPVS